MSIINPKQFSTIELLIAENPELLTEPNKIVEPHDWVLHIPFVFYLIKNLTPKVVVELGVNEGNSFNAFCQGIKEAGLDSICYGFDSYPNVDVYNELVTYQQLEYPEIGEIIKHDYTNIFEGIDKKIDILHINSLTDYATIKNILLSWLPLMSDQGVVLIHNTRVQNKLSGIPKLWKELQSDYLSHEFDFGNGLGLLIVGNNVPDNLKNYIEKLNLTPQANIFFEKIGRIILNSFDVISLRKEITKIRQQLEISEKRNTKIQNKYNPYLLVSKKVAELFNKAKSREYWKRKIRKKLKLTRVPYKYKVPNIKGMVDNIPMNTLFSIIIPTYNTPVKWLEKAVTSVKNQVYSNWEICIADDASKNVEMLDYLKKIASDRIRIVLSDFNMGISETSNRAISIAKGDYIVFLDHDDELTIDALWELNRVITESNSDFIYSDEDKVDESGKFSSPNFKPDYSSEMLLSQNYICHLACVKHELLKQVGLFNAKYDGSQDHELFLRIVEKAKDITHIPKVLYHWRMVKGSTAQNFSEKNYAWEAGRLAIEDTLARRNIIGSVTIGAAPGTYRVEREIINNPMVSIIIPFKDQPEILNTCLNSIYSKSTYQNFEILAISNNSTDDATKELVESYKIKYGKIKYLEYNHPFNYSEINNYAVQFCEGEHIVLLNNDIEIISPSWIEALLQFSQIEHVGAVGAKLLYPNNTIQHGGVIIGLGGIAGHSHTGFNHDSFGYFNRLVINQEYCAVTAACLMVKKRIYEELGGLNEIEFKIAFNDVDFCLRAQEVGYNNIYTPYCEAFHHESLSRGHEDNEEKQGRFRYECLTFEKRHKEILSNGDPHYNKNLSLRFQDFSLR